MVKMSYLFLNLLLLIAIAKVTGFPATAQPSLLSEPENGLEINVGGAGRPSGSQLKPRRRGGSRMVELEQLELGFKRKLPPARGSRSPSLCPISPGILEQEFVIWSDRPLFLWKVNHDNPVDSKTLEILQADKPEHQAEILWKTTLSQPTKGPEYEQQQYDGQTTLQPGQKYQWKLRWQQGAQGQQTIQKQQFQIMADPQRQQITTDLNQIAEQLRTQNVSQEDIAIHQARYFSDRGLLSDALQVLYSIKDPSIETRKAIGELMQASMEVVCGKNTQ
jgi:hypothetical protein